MPTPVFSFSDKVYLNSMDIYIKAVSIYKKVVFSIPHNQAHCCHWRSNPITTCTTAVRPCSSRWRKGIGDRESFEQLLTLQTISVFH